MKRFLCVVLALIITASCVPCLAAETDWNGPEGESPLPTVRDTGRGYIVYYWYTPGIYYSPDGETWTDLSDRSWVKEAADYRYITLGDLGTREFDLLWTGSEYMLRQSLKGDPRPTHTSLLGDSPRNRVVTFLNEDFQVIGEKAFDAPVTAIRYADGTYYATVGGAETAFSRRDWSGEPAKSSVVFSDVPDDAWYAPYVEVCVEDGLMKGTSDTTFSPDRELTLAEVLVLTARLYSQVEDVEIPAVSLDELVHTIEVHDENEVVLADFSDVEFFGPLTDLSGPKAWGKEIDDCCPAEWIAFRFPEGQFVPPKYYGSLTNIIGDWPFFMEPGESSPRFVSDFGTFAADDPVLAYNTYSNLAWVLCQTIFADRLMSDPSPYVWYLDEVCFLSDRQYEDRRLSWMYDLEQRLLYEAGTAADTLATRGDFGTMLGQLVTLSPIVTQRAPEGIEEIEDRGVQTLIFTGVMEGTGAGYALDKGLTRAECAAMLARITRPELRKNQAPEVPVRSPEELTQVAVQHRSFGMVEVQYTLDLEKNSLEVLSPATFGREEEKREVSPLDPAAVDAFRASPAVESLLGWGEVYYNMNILDGHQWTVTLTFSDGTSRDISGSNAYPEGWDLMYYAMLELTGQNIMSTTSDWLDWDE